MDPNAQQPQQEVPQSIPQQELHQEMPHSSLPKMLWIVLGVIVALGLIGSAYYLGIKKGATFVSHETTLKPTLAVPTTIVTQLAPSTTVPTVVDATANWQTYTNTQYGYSIKYPSNWFDKGNFTTTPAFETEHYLSNEDTKYDTLDSNGVYIYIKKILQFIIGNEQNLTASQYFNQRYAQFSGATSLHIDGQPAVMYTVDQMNYASHPGDKYAHVVTYAILVNNKDVYEIDLQGWYDNAVLTNEKLFDQIVGTITFK